MARTYFGAEQLDAMLSGPFGETMNIDDQWTPRVIVDVADSTMLGDQSASLAGKLHVATGRTGSFGPHLKEGSTFSLPETSGLTKYTVHSMFQSGDGGVTHITFLR